MTQPGAQCIGRGICIYADSRFSCSCPVSQASGRSFCPDVVIDFSNRPLRFPFNQRNNLPLSRNFKPKISIPISISHQPGVSGVIKARKPRIIQIIPKDFFAIFFIRLSIRSLNLKDEY